MHERFAVFDGHNDTLTRFFRLPGMERAILERNQDGHIDVPRALESGFAGGFFAIFTSNEIAPALPGARSESKMALAIQPDFAHEFTRSVLEYFGTLESESGAFHRITSASQLDSLSPGKSIGAVLHIEGAEALRTIDDLELFISMGVRSLGLVWSRPNQYGWGVPFACPATPDIGPGLPDQGKELVSECNRLGVLIDLSHLNEKGFWDVARLTSAPLVATHSCVHALCPAARNLTDRQIDAIGESNGVIGINFANSMLRADGKTDDPASLEDLIRHIVYVADRIGVAHVALGSDFDGTSIPPEVQDVTGLPKIAAALRSAGLTAAETDAVCLENWRRVLKATWK